MGTFFFVPERLRPNDHLKVSVLQLTEGPGHAVTFGLTTCNVHELEEEEMRRLKDLRDLDDLLDRPEYWVLYKVPQCSLNCELTFVIRNDGQVQYSENGCSFTTVMHVDPTQRFYAFFNWNESVTKLAYKGE